MKILLLEDHAAMREIICDYLVHRGFVVDAVARGEDAVVAAMAGHYDAMVLDLGLPDIDGMEVLADVRRRGSSRLPALIVTARDSIDSRVAGLNAGADDYIIKPFELVELDARLRAVLRRPGQRETPTIRCGRLVYDQNSRSVTVDNIFIDLSRRELLLLEELIRAAGRVVVKDTLEERLYSFEQEVTSNALEATVSRLRKKLLSVGSGAHLETLRGIGYRLLPEDTNQTGL